MLDLNLFRNRGFSGANLVMALLTFAMFGMLFYVSLYLQQVLGYSPVEAGASFLPWTVLITILAPIMGRLSDRVGARSIVTFGMVVLAGALLWFAHLGVHEHQPIAAHPILQERAFAVLVDDELALFGLIDDLAHWRYPSTTDSGRTSAWSGF